MFKKTALYRGLTCTLSIVLVVMVMLALVLEENRTMVDQTLGTKSQLIVTEEDDGTLYTAFTPDEDFLTNGKLDLDKDKDIHKNLSIKISEEGSVLLKNENSALPLKANAQVTVLGVRGYKSLGGRSGSFIVANGLKESGLQINPTMEAVYAPIKFSDMAPGWASNKTYDFKYNPNEPSLADLVSQDADYADSFAEYGDAAIVVLGRNNGEGADYKPGTDGVADGVGARTALALSANEKDIVKLACDNFSKVVVLVIGVSPMELGELQDNEKVGAIMYIGFPATYGCEGVGNLLQGKANPSGGLYDMYARNSLSSPAMRNMGHYELTNADKITRKDTSSVGTRGTDPGFQHYVIEAEGIYVGYRYYETRYFDCVNGDASAKTKTDATGIYEDSKTNWNYAEEVVYPFGYGLSYTTFEKKITGVTWDKSAHEQIAHVSVSVKNTGTVAGKTSVQIYGHAPYTSYDKTNGVEKSAIQLLNFEKTDIIPAGNTVNVTVDVDLQNLASYDENGAGTYIMENGEHYFAVGNGAHDALNNILAAMGKTTSDGMDKNGVADAAHKWTYDTATEANGVDSFTFSQSKNGTKIKNSLDYCNWNDYEKGKVLMLSRSDWSGTFPKTYDTMTATEQMLKHYNGEVIDVKTKSNPDSAQALAEVKFDQATELKFADMKNAEFGDYRWDEVVDAMSIEELVLFCMESGRGFAPIDSLNFPQGSYAENGPGTPAWIDNSEGVTNAPWAVEKPSGSYSLGSFPTYAVIASSFNPELSKEYGRVLGNDSILGLKPMLWLPGANIHRTPYNGRSEQYYSEDPILTGVMTMEATVGALAKGAIVTAKHFAFNDQEMHRSGVGTFMTEQRAREVDLRAFQIAFEASKYDTEEKDVGMLGVMTSFSKLGGIECTVNKGLLTDILANEWGFNGYMVSDLKDDLDLMPQAFKAGLGGYDWRTESDDITPYRDVDNFRFDAELLQCMKKVARQKMYAFANSNFMNNVNTTTHSVWNMTWWRAAYISGIVISAVLVLAALGMLIACFVINKKENA